MGGESMISKTESIPQIKKSVTMDSGDSINKQSSLSLTETPDNNMKDTHEENGSIMEKESTPSKSERPTIVIKTNGEIKEPGKSGELILVLLHFTASLMSLLTAKNQICKTKGK